MTTRESLIPQTNKPQYTGAICGNPYTDRRFPHDRSCPRKGKPFTRIVTMEFSSEYLCHGCKRAWRVMSGWGKDIDGIRELHLPADSWHWRLAAGMAARESGEPIWVRENDRGKAHLMRHGFIECGHQSVMRPFTVLGGSPFCERCNSIEG